MKLPSKHNSLPIAGFVGLLVLSMSSHTSAAPFPLFTVDPHGAFGALGGPHPGPFQADKITGNSSTIVSTTDPAEGTQHGSGWINFNAFANAGQNDLILATVSGLNADWQMWAEFTYELKLAGGPYAQTGSTYTVTSLSIDFWVDPSIATRTEFAPATNAGAAPLVTHGADAFKIATASLIVGVANVNALDGTGFNSTNNFNLLNPVGTSLFTAPVPFYRVQFDEFNNTSQGVFIDPEGRFITINQASSNVDFQSIPEPASLALLGIGLLGICISKAAGKRPPYST